MAVIKSGDLDARKNFAEWPTNPGAWASSAHNLRISAMLLWPPIQKMFDLHKTDSQSDEAFESLWRAGFGYGYLLLAGAALESMTKAAAIQIALNTSGHAGVLESDGLSLQRWITTHDFVALWPRARLEADAQTEEQLRRFTTFVEWAGRYPTPKRPPKADDPNDRSKHPEHIVRDFDHFQFESLYGLAKSSYDVERVKVL